MSGERSLSVKLPWQGSQWQRLVSQYNSNKLPHALLLTGPAGIGKKRFALALSHFLMCSNRGPSVPCGECRQCHFNLAGTHPDLKVIEVEEKSRQIKIDQIRAQVATLAQTSQQGGYKIAILTAAESMNNNAANALLKSLEEPAADTLIMLLTDSPGQLLATIRSRCQTVLFPLPDSVEALSWLEAMLPPGEPAKQILAEASGRPLIAQGLLGSDGLARRQRIRHDFLAMLNGKLSAMALAEMWKDLELDELLDWLSRSVVSLVGHRLGTAELTEDWGGVGDRVDIRNIFILFDEINLLKSSISRGANPNKQLALENLLLKTCEQFHR